MIRASFISIAICMVAVSPACAHGLLVTCKLQGGKVEVQVFYDDRTDAAKAKVQLVNDNGEEIATGVTNDKGKCWLKTPAPGKYVVHADAGAGHRAKKELVVPLGMKTEPVGMVETPGTSPGQNSVNDEREELTRTPWLKIGIGLATIVALSGAFLIATRMRKS